VSPVPPVDPVDLAVLVAGLGTPLPLLLRVRRSRRLLRGARRRARAAAVRRALMTGVFDGALPADDPGVHAWIAWCHAVAAGGPARPLPTCRPASERAGELSPRGLFLLERAEAVAAATARAGRGQRSCGPDGDIDLTAPRPAAPSGARHRAPCKTADADRCPASGPPPA